MSSERVHLGQFVLDMGRYELTRAGKPFAWNVSRWILLILLVRESGRLVSREADDSGVDCHKRLSMPNHKLTSDQKTRDSQYAVSCSSIAGVSRRS
jgi:hypothetical protein